MRVLVYADFRSPHALGWREGLIQAGIEVVAVSSHCVAAPDIEAWRSGMAKARERGALASSSPTRTRQSLLQAVASRQISHTALEGLTGWQKRALLRDEVSRSAPDLVHALRVPYEALTALGAVRTVPVIASSWGLDFRLQAQHDPVLRTWMRRLLPRAAGFTADAPADLDRARTYGLRDVPTLLAAGNFGVTVPRTSPAVSRRKASRCQSEVRVLCLRRPANNVRIDRFLHAAAAAPDGMEFELVGCERLLPKDRVLADALVRRGRLQLHPSLPREEFLELLDASDIAVSPAIWDGTPNTVLEALVRRVPVVAGYLPQLEELRDVSRLRLVNLDSASELQLAIEAAASDNFSGRYQNRVQALPAWTTFEANLARVPNFYEEVLR